jgi:hypothetical protein
MIAINKARIYRDMEKYETEAVDQHMDRTWLPMDDMYYID